MIVSLHAFARHVVMRTRAFYNCPALTHEQHDTRPLTQRDTIAACRAVNCVCRIVDREYAVRHRNTHADATYYTNDAADAIATARAMNDADAVDAIDTLPHAS